MGAAVAAVARPEPPRVRDDRCPVPACDIGEAPPGEVPDLDRPPGVGEVGGQGEGEAVVAGLNSSGRRAPDRAGGSRGLPTPSV